MSSLVIELYLLYITTPDRIIRILTTSNVFPIDSIFMLTPLKITTHILSKIGEKVNFTSLYFTPIFSYY